MNRLTDPKFADIIKKLPVQDHAVAITSKELLRLLPAGSSLSRSYLLGQAPSKNLLTEIISWGYPADKRGTATRILEPSILAKLNSTMCVGVWASWGDFFSKFGKGKSVPYVGVVTATKIAYFYKVNLQGFDGLILDGRIINAKNYWHELAHLKFLGSNNFNDKQYVAYLDVMHTTAAKIGCTADQLEFFLFTFGASFG